MTQRSSCSRPRATTDHAIIEQAFADLTDRPLAHLPSFQGLCRLAGPGGHRAPPPPPRRRLPRLPPLREGQERDHHPPRPDQRRRPGSPLRPGQPDPAPPPGLAPPGRMGEPVRRLRAARPRGLTSPDPVTADHAPRPATQMPPQIADQYPGQAAEQASGRNTTATTNPPRSIPLPPPGNGHQY